MSENTSWFSKGFEDINKNDYQANAGPSRFWMPKESEKEITFIDSEPFTFWECNMQMNGNWRNWFTSLKSLNQTCPLEEAGFKPYYVGMFTIIDHSEWTDKKGNTHKDEVKLFPAKITVLKKLKRQMEKKGSLKGCKFTVYRSDDKSPATGDEFEFVDRIDVDKTFPEAKAFIYEDIFAPKSEDELKRLAGLPSNEKSSVDNEEDVPF